MSLWDTVCDLVEKHKLNDQKGKKDPKVRSKIWQRITAEYNAEHQSVAGPKTQDQLQNGWNNYLSRLKKRTSEHKAETKKTGGGQMSKALDLDEDEQRHVCIGNAVNKTYETEFDSEHEEKSKKTKPKSNSKKQQFAMVRNNSSVKYPKKMQPKILLKQV